MLTLSLDRQALAAYVGRQVSRLFPDSRVAGRHLADPVEQALERLEYCFRRIALKRFGDGPRALFDHLHTDQYAMFLYWVSRAIYRAEGDLRLAAKLYALNKALHAIDVFYEVDLPEIFVFQHPVGTVLGRATFSNYLLVYQHCTVGSSRPGAYPTLGEGVVMYAGSAILGRCVTGANCWLAAGAQAIDADLPANSVVFGQSPGSLLIRPTWRNVIEQFFSRQATHVQRGPPGPARAASGSGGREAPHRHEVAS